jgi:sterol desaturase/sphingolipid hydroxylase (fatty acid hydroxylase superfamily)
MNIWLTIPLAFVFMHLSTYWIHRWLHATEQREHEAHHWEIYPPSNFLSYRYENPSHWATLYQFLVYGGPVALAFLAVSYWLGWAPALHGLGSCLALGFADQYLHDAVHIRGHWLERFSWFRRLRLLHVTHHLDPESNYGICLFFADRVFRTYNDHVGASIETLAEDTQRARQLSSR